MYNSLSPESHHVQCVWLSEWKSSLTRISRSGIRRCDQFQFFSLEVSSFQSSYLNPLVLALFFVLTLQIYCFWVAGLRDQWPVWRWAQKAEPSSAHPVFDPHFPWKRVSENGQAKCDSMTIVVTNNVFSNNYLSMQFVSSTPSWSAGVPLSLLPEKRKLIYFPKERRRTYRESCIAPSGYPPRPEWSFPNAAEHTCFSRTTGYQYPLYAFFEDVCRFDGTNLSLQTWSFSRGTMRKLPGKEPDPGK